MEKTLMELVEEITESGNKMQKLIDEQKEWAAKMAAWWVKIEERKNEIEEEYGRITQMTNTPVVNTHDGIPFDIKEIEFDKLVHTCNKCKKRWI